MQAIKMQCVSKELSGWKCSERGNSSWVTVWQDSWKDPSHLCHTDGSSVIKREEEGAGWRNHNAMVIQIKQNYNAFKGQMPLSISLGLHNMWEKWRCIRLWMWLTCHPWAYWGFPENLNMQQRQRLQWVDHFDKLWYRLWNVLFFSQSASMCSYEYLFMLE